MEGMLGAFHGIKIIPAPHCMRTVWNFPQSKNRSRRQHKKLLKRFGVQSYQEPAAYMISGSLYAHPKIIENMVNDKRIVSMK